MEAIEELSPHELIALREIRLTGRLSDHALVGQFIQDELIVCFETGDFELTARGKYFLVRGSTSLWEPV